MEALAENNGQHAAGAVLEASGNVEINRSIENLGEGSASCAASVQDGSCDVHVPDASGEATSTWKRRLVTKSIVY